MIDSKAFLSNFDEFVHVKESKISMYLTYNTNLVDSIQYGDNYETGVFLLTAHSLAMIPKMMGGSVSAEKVGDIAYNYNSIQDEEFLSQSNYGLMFLELRRSCVVSAIVL